MHAFNRSFSSRTLVAVAAVWIGLAVILLNTSRSIDPCVDGVGPRCTGAGSPTAAPPASGTAPTLAPTTVVTTVPSSGPTPVVYTFRDEFKRPGLKPEWGRHWPGFGATDWSSEQISIGGDVLTFTARREGIRFVSGLIDTVGTFEQRYGTFSARIRFTEGGGLWPAFWLAQPQNAAREMAEIDVMEICANPIGANGGNDVTLLHSYIHREDGSVAFAFRLRTATLAGDWHEYSTDWRPDHVSFAIDGVEFARFTDATEVPDMRMAIVLDLAGGGRFCGRADETTPDTATMEVDWVRVTE
jgi:beta-glucanase (GH16 family)